MKRRGSGISVSGGGGSSFDPASPGAIGGTTPAAGSFTTLSASTSASIASPTFTGAATGAYYIATTSAYPAGYMVIVSGQSPVGFYRNTSVGGMSLYSGIQATPSDINADAVLISTGFRLLSSIGFGWSSTNVTQSRDTSLWRAAANSVLFNGSDSAATTTSRAEMNKAIASVANTVATDLFTVTIPNAAHTASFELQVCGALGAGGAIGAREAAATNCYAGTIVRTAGVATVVTLSAAYGAAASAVAGAATVTCTAAASAMTGAVGATQTITRSGGSSDNHTCQGYIKLLNAAATGITVA